MGRDYRNVLLQVAAPSCLAPIEPELELVELSRLQMIACPAEPLEFVYFMEDSMASLVSHLDDKRDVELGLIGREGMTGEPLVLGDDRTPFSVRAQMAGSAWRIRASRLREELDRKDELLSLLLRFVRAKHLQVASTAASNQRGSIEERLARWILMAHDRIDGDQFRVTHDSLSWMLAVRRSSITEALHVLEGKGLIRSERGILTVRNIADLRAAAGRAYGLAEREYARLIGVDFRDYNRSSTRSIPELSVEDVPHDEG
jgi:CRP-like cAMP-binding protein